MKITSLLAKVVDILIPPICGICQCPVSKNATLCPECFSKLNFITKPYCHICGRPFEFDIMGERVCAKCLMKRPLFLKARSAVQYDEASKKLLLPFKHADRLDLVPLLVKLMRPTANDLMPETDIILAVPLHWLRLLKRKYNQSDELAYRLAKIYHKTYVPNVLKRQRATPSQGHLTAQERNRNVRGAFKVTHPNKIKGKRILLIDDVLTTGSTVNECTKVLLKAGAKSVDVLTIARVVKN